MIVFLICKFVGWIWGITGTTEAYMAGAVLSWIEVAIVLGIIIAKLIDKWSEK